MEEEAEVAVAASDEVSTMLLCVMKRRRSFMAGRKVMMIFSTWGKKRNRDKMMTTVDVRERESNYISSGRTTGFCSGVCNQVNTNRIQFL